MADNYTLIKISLYRITRNDGYIRWQCFYDTAHISPGVRYFEKTYNSVYDLYSEYGLKVYSYNNWFWREGIYKEIGIMIRGFKCYKYLKKHAMKDYIVIKDIMKDLIQVI